MGKIDIIVFIIYLLGLIGVGSIFSRMKNTKEMFAAGGQSPWWLSGLSGFMTTFSAGTFVIWGGIAYRFGLVGVSILVVIGFAAIFVGWFLAGRWKSFGYDSAAEFLNDRYGKSLVRFYTVLQGLFGVFTMGGAVYALAVVVTILIPLSEGHILADPATGYFSVNIASLIICALVILITFGGGLWAVLITDALQFIILTASVLIVVPLIVMEVGGPAEMIRTAPPGFLNLVNSEFTWLFLFGWGIVFFFKIGGEWAYVQRFVCVPNSKDAKKSTYLFGILYIVSPIIWMLPPMAYRWINPNADYEQAYILASQAVLPAGMLGLMIAAMCSATASMATTQLNVFAGAFTTEIYQRVIKPDASDDELVKVGRFFTLLLGGIIIAGALLIPVMGTYTGYILASVAILTGPLVLPTIWGLFSRKIGVKTAWAVSVISLTVGLTVKLGFESGGWLAELRILSSLTQSIQANIRVTDILVGTVFPLLLLVIAELSMKTPSLGWAKVVANRNKYSQKVEVIPSTFPARLCAWSTFAVGVMVGIIALINSESRFIVGGFSIALMTLGILVLLIISKDQKGKRQDKIIADNDVGAILSKSEN